MSRSSLRSWRWRAASVMGAATVVAFVIFGTSGKTQAPLGTGQQTISAQPSGLIEGAPFSFAAIAAGGARNSDSAQVDPQADSARQAAAAAVQQTITQRM